MENQINVEQNEDIEFQEDVKTFFRSNSPVNLYNLNEPLLHAWRNGSFPQMNGRNSIGAAPDTYTVPDWQDELDEFTSKISRQARTVLGRIKNRFLQNGLQFNVKFRENFISTVNNR